MQHRDRARVYQLAVNALQLVAELASDEEDRACLLGAAEAFAEIAGPSPLRSLSGRGHELPQGWGKLKRPS